jgi:hypothetical protein
VSLFDLLFQPGRYIRDLSARWPWASAGLIVLALTAAGWTALCLALDTAGHAPSGPLALPVPRESYYAFQAVAVWPTLLAAAGAMAATIQLLGRALGASGRFAEAMTIAGVSLGAPTGGLWLVPDAAVWALAGFEALGGALLFILPIWFAWTLGLATAGIRALRGLSTGRAVAVALAGAFAAGLVVGPILR